MCVRVCMDFMCKCVFFYVCVYLCVCSCVCVFMQVYLCACIHVCMLMCVRLCICACVCPCCCVSGGRREKMRVMEREGELERGEGGGRELREG